MATLNGTGGADVLNGTIYNDLIYGKSGDDIIFTNGGNDTVYGGAGNDRIVIGSGTSNLYGGVGQDTFAVAAGATGVGVLRDWQDGQDRIDLSDLGITSLNDITIRQSGVWTVIDTGDVDLRIKTSQLGGGLSADDFVFASADDPLPAGGTVYDFDGMLLFGSADGASRTGNFVADFEGFTGGNESPTGAGGNGYISQAYIFGIPASNTTIQANMAFMETDIFDFEAFKTSDRDGFTMIGFLDGVEVGRQTFAGVTEDWTEIRPDDAIFDTVDMVQFVGGIASLDDMLIIA